MAKRILVVDDHFSMLLALQAGLEQGGYEVTTSADGLSALHQFHKNPPDLIILDIKMAGLDGWAVCQEIRKTSTVPIIMLSGYHQSQADRRKGLKMGANAYLVKPVSIEELQNCMQAILKS